MLKFLLLKKIYFQIKIIKMEITRYYESFKNTIKYLFEFSKDLFNNHISISS